MEEKIKALGHIMDHLKPHDVFKIGDITITTTIVNTWIVMAVLFAVVIVLTQGAKLLPKGKQNVVEMFVEFIYGLIDQSIGKEGRKHAALIGTFFIFILFMNLSWLIPELKPPTMDISTTAALAVFAIIAVQIIGIKRKGFKGYCKHFAEPIPALLPLNILEEIVKPFSLTLRLFGNLFAEEIVVGILFILMPLFLPVPVQFLGILTGSIQAFVFSLLVTIYISAMYHGH